ncbi:hypothetical protein D3C76_1375460 [compost metagenome]
MKWFSAAWVFPFLQNGCLPLTSNRAAFVSCSTIIRPPHCLSALCSVVSDDVQRGRWHSSIFSASAYRKTAYHQASVERSRWLAIELLVGQPKPWRGLIALRPARATQAMARSVF